MKKQMSETFLLGILLAAAGGFLDAYTYLCRGHVFANAQTGNMVLLGIHLAEGNVRQGLVYLIPVGAFALGILVSEWVKGRGRNWNHVHWRQLVVLAELLILVLVAFIPLGNWNMAANVLVSFVCAMQVEAFRKMNGNAYATTMCTGNLRSGTELLIRACQKGSRDLLKKSFSYYGVILFFMAGAGLGAAAAKELGQWAVLPAAGLLFLVFALMFVKSE